MRVRGDAGAFNSAPFEPGFFVELIFVHSRRFYLELGSFFRVFARVRFFFMKTAKGRGFGFFENGMLVEPLI